MPVKQQVSELIKLKKNCHHSQVNLAYALITVKVSTNDKADVRTITTITETECKNKATGPKNSHHLQVMCMFKQLRQSIGHLTKPFSIEMTAFL